MNPAEVSSRDNVLTVTQDISKLIANIENYVSLNKKHAKECTDLNVLKEKCCSTNLIISLTAFHGLNKLVEKNILNGSQTVSTLVSLLPSVSHCNPLISTIGDILVLDLKEQLLRKKIYQCIYSSGELEHPFVMILKSHGSKSWTEIYSFIHSFIETNDNIKVEYKIKLVEPVFHYVFWSSEWKGSQFLLKLFNTLMQHSNAEEFVLFTLELLMWLDVDMQYCLFLQDIFAHLLNCGSNFNKSVLSALTPSLAEAIKWLILNGCNPTLWIKLLWSSIQLDDSSLSTVLYILTDAVGDTPSLYINALINVCKSIIFSCSCNKYVVHRFIAVALNWFINPSSLSYPLYVTLEEIILFVQENTVEWNDYTFSLNNNEYFKNYGKNNINVKFAVDFINISNSWNGKTDCLIQWLLNLKESNEYKIQLKLHSSLLGIVLCENDKTVIGICFDILFKLIDHCKDISFSCICLLFYKLARETDPYMQKMFLFLLPKLAVKKENIPLIIGIIESLKKGNPVIMTPVVIQLYLTLWKLDNRTYSYLHKMLHDTHSEGFNLEQNISKAVALREICRTAPHAHAKDVVSVLSQILNECANHSNGLPSAITTEAVTELCKAYVIDPSGTWDALGPKLSFDKRPKVLVALCKFFGEIPNLNSSGKKYNDLIKTVVEMLWNYTYSDDKEVVRNAFEALSKFEIENLDLKLLPEIYRTDVQLPKKNKNSVADSIAVEDVLDLPYVLPECWIQFLEKLNEDNINYGCELLMAIVRREVNSLARGIFYLPPEKSEPLSYSYLSQRSICRILIEQLQKHEKNLAENLPFFIKKIIYILSKEYSRAFPPLNWSFMSVYLDLTSNYSFNTLIVLAKQASVSESAKSMLENHLSKTQWNGEKLEEIEFIYSKIIFFCSGVAINVFQVFIGKTMKTCLRNSLETDSCCFENVLHHVHNLLKDKNISLEYKTAVAKTLENILELIPPQHKVMKNYAICATELPMKSVEKIAVCNSLKETTSEWLHRAVIIRWAIAMRPEIENPLTWFNEVIDAAGLFPSMQSLILYNILSIIRCRRTSNFTTWLDELMWRIQTSISGSESIEVSLFLIHMFASAVIILSGYDCLFDDVNEIATKTIKVLQVFPQSLSRLLNFSEWIASLPKISQWVQKLLKWKQLPEIYVKAFAASTLNLKNFDKNSFNYYIQLHLIHTRL